MAPTNRSKSVGIAVLVMLWVTLVMAGLWGLEAYKASAPETSAVSLQAVYPEFQAASDRAGLPRLVMFLHPQCPCSRASLVELREILARCPSTEAEIVLVKPPGTPPGWDDTAVVREAQSLPRTKRTQDNGTLAQRLGAETSGHLLLVNAKGKVLFSGGITRSRGHVGDSEGRRTVLALLQGDASAAQTTPVFGCPLLSENACEACNNCCEPDKAGSLR